MRRTRAYRTVTGLTWGGRPDVSAPNTSQSPLWYVNSGEDKKRAGVGTTGDSSCGTSACDSLVRGTANGRRLSARNSYSRLQTAHTVHSPSVATPYRERFSALHTHSCVFPSLCYQRVVSSHTLTWCAIMRITVHLFRPMGAGHTWVDGTDCLMIRWCAYARARRWSQTAMMLR